MYMKTIWLKILPYISIPMVLAIGAIVYKAGVQSAQEVDKSIIVLEKIKDLTELTKTMKTELELMTISHSDIKASLLETRKTLLTENNKINMKVDRIVENIPNNSKLIRQLYDIERAIERKNDTIDMLTQRNEILKNEYKIGAKKTDGRERDINER